MDGKGEFSKAQCLFSGKKEYCPKEFSPGDTEQSETVASYIICAPRRTKLSEDCENFQRINGSLNTTKGKM